MKTSILNVIKTLALLMIVAFSITACDKDFTNIESDIKGSDNFSSSSKEFPFIAYNQTTSPAQTNELSSSLLGIYNDPNFGTTSANLVSQIVPDNLSPDFGTNPEIISVKLYIPYFSTSTDDSIYALDSLYGQPDNNYKLSVIRNNYFLRDLDQDSNNSANQAYYSDFDSSAHEGELLYENTMFSPSNEIVEITETPIGGTTPETIELSKTPGLYADLTQEEFSVTDWKNFLLPDGTTNNPDIEDANLFKQAFRGLIFKVEQNSGNDGNLSFLDINNAKIDIRYENGTTEERTRATYSLNFNAIKFNSFEAINSQIALTNGDETTGDDQLLLKGLEGSMAVIDLFNGNVTDDNNATTDALSYFKDKKEKWIINEANLNFYVDQTALSGGDSEPDRVILYDLKNNTPIIDYLFDTSSNALDPVNSKTDHSPKLERDANNNGVKYKIKLTEHVNRILLKDSTNVKLGLYVSTNVNITGISKIDGAENDIVNMVPKSSVTAPEGTILHGNTDQVSPDLKAVFEIFYTESQN